ncbi:twin-arginine translocation signal domain-containing protein [Microvirga sp. 2YAF29]|uniref:twin-arginine translocation signal domain-containing protein n=1 Tax=Microvirga sp. 2YAF29 TaxID=3233031 RepID=UPI003F9E2163
MLPQSRRSFLHKLACAGLAGAGLLAYAPAQAQGFPQAFSAFSVDVSALKAKGLGPFADLVAQAALDELHRSFADRVDPRGPRFVLVITGIFLTPFPDGAVGWRREGGGGGGSDGMDGEALAVGRNGEILARHPQHATLQADRSIRDPDELGRAAAMARNYVLWLRRRL